VVLIRRELDVLGGKEKTVTPESIDAYLAPKSKRRLTKLGILYWLIERASVFTGTPFGGKPLPDVDPSDPEIGLPDYIK
jgi:hypothetical protein